MWTGLITWWSNSKVAQFMTWALVALVGWETVKRHIKEEAKKAERSAIAKRQAETSAAIAVTQKQVIIKESHNADEALAARDSAPVYPTADSMPDDAYFIAFGRPKGGGANSR